MNTNIGVVAGSEGLYLPPTLALVACPAAHPTPASQVASLLGMTALIRWPILGVYLPLRGVGRARDCCDAETLIEWLAQRGSEVSKEICMPEVPILPTILVIALFTLLLAIEWVRAARLPAARWRAIWNSVVVLVLLALLLTNVGGLGRIYGSLIRMLLALGAATPIVEVLWAAIDLILLVVLGVEVNRLARVRDSKGHS